MKHRSRSRVILLAVGVIVLLWTVAVVAWRARTPFTSGAFAEDQRIPTVPNSHDLRPEMTLANPEDVATGSRTDVDGSKGGDPNPAEAIAETAPAPEGAPRGSRVVELVSAEDGSPVTQAVFRIDEYFEGMAPSLEPRWFPMGEPLRSESDDGSHAVDGVGLDAYSVQARVRLVIESPGFALHRVDYVLDALQRGTTLRVELEGAPTVKLQFLGSDGRPFTRPMGFRAADSVGLEAIQPDREGRVSEFTLSSPRFEFCSPRRTNDVIAELITAQAKPNQDGFVEVVVPTGRVEVVVGALDPSAVGCIRRGHIEMEATKAEAGLVCFEQVPVGDYAVGPLETVRLESVNTARGMPAYSLLLSRLQTLRVDLSAVVAAPQTIDGYVRCIGIAPNLVEVFAFYGAPGNPITCNPDKEGVPVQDDGTFSLTGLATVPTRLLFGFRDEEDKFSILALGSVDGENVVACGRIELPAKTEGCEGSRTVHYGFAGIDEKLIGMRSVEGACDAAFVVERVPAGRHKIQVFTSGGRAILDVSVTAGETTKIDP